jgi:hypothetical protein
VGLSTIIRLRMLVKRHFCSETLDFPRPNISRFSERPVHHKREQKTSKVLLRHNLEVGVFMTLCAPEVIILYYNHICLTICLTSKSINIFKAPVKAGRCNFLGVGGNHYESNRHSVLAGKPCTTSGFKCQNIGDLEVEPLCPKLQGYLLGIWK